MITFIQQLGLWPVVATQFVQACPDVIDGIAAKVAAVWNASD
jgi:hypothetical protein